MRHVPGLSRCCAAAITGAFCTAGAAFADFQIFGDASFFDSIPHTLVDFETRGDGTPITLDTGEVASMAVSEYSPTGFRWTGLTRASWADDSSPDVDAAQAIVGSLENLVLLEPSSPGATIGIEFLNSTRSFGFAFVFNQTLLLAPQSLTIKDQALNVIVDLTIDETLIDAFVGDIGYGYVSFTTDVEIRSIFFSESFGIGYDDLRFSHVPAPAGGAVLLVALGFSGFGRRRGQ